MRFTIGLALVAALGAAACKKKTADVSTTGSGSSGGSAGSGSATTGSGTAVQAAPAIDAAAVPWTTPANATAVTGDADATALGTAVMAHLVERIEKPTPGDDHRQVKLVLVLEGNGKAIAADETSTYAQDGSPAAMAIKTESDIVHLPLTPPRPFQGSDSDPPLDFKGPLLFQVRLTAKDEDHVIAVGKDKNSLVVWTLVVPSDSVDVAPDWETTGTIKLAPGATVTGAGSGS